MKRRPLFAALLSGLMLSSISFNAHSQNEAWPNRPVRLIVPAAPGGSPDTLARLLATRMSDTLKQPVLIETRPGAGGVIGARALLAAQDSHTFMLMVTSVAAVLPVSNPGANFDAVRDLAPVASIGYTPMLMVAATGTSVKNFDEAIAFARRAQTPPVFAHAGPGTMSHLAQERIAQMAGMKVLSVSFGSPAKTLAGLVGGDAQFYVDAVSVMVPMIQAGRVVPLTVLSPEKLPGLEAIPVASERVPGLVAVGAFGVMGPRNTPPADVALLGRAVAHAMQDNDIVLRLREMGIYPNVTDAAGYDRLLRQEQDVWGGVARSLNIQAGK